MVQRRVMSVIAVGIVTAIGCGGGQPQDASATPEDGPATDATIQLAYMPSSVPASSRVAVVGEVKGGATSIQGVIRFEGTPPDRTKIKMAADPVCQQQHADPVYSEEVVVNDNGTLRNVFVYVKEGITGSFPTPSEPVTLDQAGCQYSPHVAGIQANQPLEIVNSDATLHNVNAKPTNNRPFNVAQPIKGMKTKKKFTKPEVMVRFKCNVHPWMNAYLGVLEHPFFNVSGEDGAFAISGLPAGTYVMEAWHETYGTQTQNVSVADGETQSVEFTFSAE